MCIQIEFLKYAESILVFYFYAFVEITFLIKVQSKLYSEENWCNTVNVQAYINILSVSLLKFSSRRRNKSEMSTVNDQIKIKKKNSLRYAIMKPVLHFPFSLLQKNAAVRRAMSAVR